MEAVKKKRSHKKTIITIVVIVAVIGGLFAACSAMAKTAKKKMEAAQNAIQTDVVTVRDLTQSIGATGKVASVQSEDLTTTLMGVEITDVLVEVGDTVEAGQTVVQFDTEDIARSLSIAQRALNQTQGQFAIASENAERGVEDAVRATDYQAQVAYDNIEKAYDAYVGIFDTIEDLQESEDKAWDDWADAENQYDKAEEEYKKAVAAAAERYTNGEVPESMKDHLTPEEIKELEVLLEDLGVYMVGLTTQSAQSALTQAAANVAQKEAAYKQTQAARESAEDSVGTLHDAYVSAIEYYENIVATGESTVASAQAAQQSTELSANTDQQQLQVDNLAEQLEEGIMTAPISGVVTAVNFDDGDIYTQGVIMTIQDCSAFEIEAQIGEYDISDISLGQKVIIKTDATRNQELEGTVIFVAPTATVVDMSLMGMGAATASAGSPVSTDPTYEVRISVDTPSDRLRLDMSANLSIIIQEQTNVLCVPYNAVQIAEDGSAYVETVADDGKTLTTVPVTVVMESSYYTQIEGDLQEGQTVRVISGETSDMFSVMAEMSPTGGGF